MDIAEAIIIGSIINMIGFIILLQFRDRSWFKKENWKVQKKKTEDLNRLDIQKIRKEMGLSTPKTPAAEPAPAAGLDLKAILPLLSKLDPDQLSGLIEQFTGGGEDVESNPLTDGLVAILDKVPPEMIQGFLSKLATTGESSGGQNTGFKGQ